MWKRGICFVCILWMMLLVSVLPGFAESWSQINQPMNESEAWSQIVQESSFSLGAQRTVTASDGLSFRELDFDTYPSIDGSTVSVPMVMEFARQHLGLPEEDLLHFVVLSTTHNAYVNLIEKKANGSAQIVSQAVVMDDKHPVDLFIGTEPSDEELALAAARGVALLKKPICYDAFVFIVHMDNPIESLTVAQIQGIYGGEITDWDSVGGDAGEIKPYARNKNSGSQTAMENLVMKGKPLAAKAMDGYFLNEMSSLVFAIGGGGQYSTHGIGYTYKYYIDELYKSEDIKVLAVDGVYPTAENVRSGAYPFSTQYFGVIRRGEEEDTGGLFLDWMLSEEGQACIAQAGYVPVTQPNNR